MPRLAGWAFMAADVFDDADKVVVRLEAPGTRREDFHVGINGDLLTVWGEKYIDREATLGRWHVVQRACGSFRRDVILPMSVKADQTQAKYRDGVLRIELPKSDAARVRRIPVQTRLISGFGTHSSIDPSAETARHRPGEQNTST